MTITELSQQTGVSKHTLRYYERAGLVPFVERDRSSGHRRYGAQHAQWIQFLRNLRETGMPIREIKAYARLVTKGDGSWPDRRVMLATHRARVQASITALRKHRAMLDRKLAAGCAPATVSTLRAR
jgi:DNA-binding transcriptional MerR regulator